MQLRALRHELLPGLDGLQRYILDNNPENGLNDQNEEPNRSNITWVGM